MIILIILYFYRYHENEKAGKKRQIWILEKKVGDFFCRECVENFAINTKDQRKVVAANDRKGVERDS